LFTSDIVTFDIWFQLALSRLGSDALLLCNYPQLLRRDLFESLPAAAVTCATPCVCLLLLPFLLFTHHTSHGGRRSCIWSGMRYERGRQCARGVGVGLRVKQTQCSRPARLSTVKILGNYCIAVYCETKLILCRRTLKLRRKLRCDTAYWQHCCQSVISYAIIHIIALVVIDLT